MKSYLRTRALFLTAALALLAWLVAGLAVSGVWRG